MSETKICNDCGKEYESDEVTESAPYAMCPDCYDEWAITNSALGTPCPNCQGGGCPVCSGTGYVD